MEIERERERERESGDMNSSKPSTSSSSSSESSSGVTGSSGARWRLVIGGSGSERVKFTCLDVDHDANFVLLGTSTGKIHIYCRGTNTGAYYNTIGDDRISNVKSSSYKFDRIVSPREDGRKGKLDDLYGKGLVEIKYDEHLDACAVVTSGGLVYIFHLGLQQRSHMYRTFKEGHLHLELDKHKGCRVTQLLWLHCTRGVLLCVADDTGKLTFTDFTAEVIKKSKLSKFESSIQQMLKIKGSQDGRDHPAELCKEWSFDSSIVQLSSTPEEVVIVSTKHASYLMHIPTNTKVQVGKKPRNGHYGCCIPLDLPATDIFNTLRECEDPNSVNPFTSIYIASRPGRRLWIAVGNDVKGTMKLSCNFKSLPSQEEDAGWLKSLNPEQGNFQLGQLYSYGNSLVSVNKSALAIVSLSECALKCAWSMPKGDEGKTGIRVLHSGTIFLLSPSTSQVIMYDKNEVRNGAGHIDCGSAGDDRNGKNIEENGAEACHSRDEETLPKEEEESSMNGKNGIGYGIKSAALKDKESSVIEISVPKDSLIQPAFKDGDAGSLAHKTNADTIPTLVMEEMQGSKRNAKNPARPQMRSQAKSGTKHQRTKSGTISRRKKSTIVEISISKREDVAADAKETNSENAVSGFSSSAPADQELDVLISSLTLQAERLESVPVQTNSESEEKMASEGEKIVDDCKDFEEQSTTSEVRSFLKENSKTILDPWYSYLHASPEEIREALQSWYGSLNQTGKDAGKQCRKNAMEELSGAYKTLDASLSIFPLLQWLYLYRKAKKTASQSQEEIEDEDFLLRVCNQLKLGTILESGELIDLDSTRELTNSSGTSVLSDDVEKVVSILENLNPDCEDSSEDALRRVFLSRPSELWCSILSGSLEKVIKDSLDYCQNSDHLERKIEMMCLMGWNLVGCEFAVEMLTNLVHHVEFHPNEESRNLALKTLRSISYLLVKMQEQERKRDVVAQSIFFYIEKYLNSPNPLALGSFREIRAALDFELHNTVDTSSSNLEEAFAEKLLAWDPERSDVDEEQGHWGIRCPSVGDITCPVCHLKIMDGADDEAIFVFPGGEIYHKACCPEDAPTNSMPDTLGFLED